ncbi:MAG: tetratricopeptide repeat-containing sensor histidine kinase [Saprospiraceae bacterium]|nr:tetratricopeptide repeat-containing sensor histidine kinase [Saprospiraceae bacterium]
MRVFFCLICFIWFPFRSQAQLSATDSLRQVLDTAQYIPHQISTLTALCFQLRHQHPDSAIAYGQQALALALANDLPYEQAYALSRLGLLSTIRGNFEQAQKELTESLSIFTTLGDSIKMSDAYQGLGNVYRRSGQLAKALEAHLTCKKIREERGGSAQIVGWACHNIGTVFLATKEWDRALTYFEQALEHYDGLDNHYDQATTLNNVFVVHYRQGNYEKALQYIERARAIFEAQKQYMREGTSLINIGELLTNLKRPAEAQKKLERAVRLFEQMKDSTYLPMAINTLGYLHHEQGRHLKALEYFQRGLALATAKNDIHGMMEVHESLADELTGLNRHEEALVHFKAYTHWKDSLDVLASTEELNAIKAELELAQVEQENERLRLDQNRISRERKWLILGLLLFLLSAIIGGFAWINRRRAFARLQHQKEEIEQLLTEKDRLYDKLKNAQLQLIQSEKMASIGQLTAGVAHELNNPIGFVSANAVALQQDVKDLQQFLTVAKVFNANPSTENRQQLLDTYQQMDIGFLDQEIQSLIESIIRGASRTRDIVTSLRTFSRNTTEVFALSDIHEGLESTLTILNSAMGNRIELIRDYGEIPPVRCQITKLNQVFLNLINNAIQAIEGEGKIQIQTRQIDEQVRIRICDTGKGMSEAVRKRIFEPFFTTKEIGAGTGLGLSISYGIIEQHQGTINARSREGKGTTLEIWLPIGDDRD